ncbi:MAG: DoxX family protein [Alcaligenaceae bacterium]|nr:DoxX family protein [Alcaligenaceae bacterium]
MSQNSLDDFARLLLRLVLGILIFFHGWAKIRHGIGGIEAMLAMRGLPAFLAWGVYLGEVLAPLLLILGIYTRLGAALIIVNMLVALFLAHSGHFSHFTSSGGWRLELQGMFLAAGVAILMLGAGRYSLGGRWN